MPPVMMGGYEAPPTERRSTEEELLELLLAFAPIPGGPVIRPLKKLLPSLMKPSTIEALKAGLASGRLGGEARKYSNSAIKAIHDMDKFFGAQDSPELISNMVKFLKGQGLTKQQLLHAKAWFKPGSEFGKSGPSIFKADPEMLGAEAKDFVDLKSAIDILLNMLK